jgi:hypothetical protein
MKTLLKKTVFQEMVITFGGPSAIQNMRFDG